MVLGFEERTRRGQSLSQKECENIVRAAWGEATGSNQIDSVLHNVESCRANLVLWASEGKLDAYHQIQEVQKMVAKQRRMPQSSEVRDELRELLRGLEKLYEDQANYRKQRSKMAWMKKGDRNTHFFHAKATTRAQHNKATELQDRNGTKWNQRNKIAEIVGEYVRDLFSTTNPEEGDVEEVLNAIEPRLTHGANQDLARPFTQKEVSDALSIMYPLKSPGPDGFPVIFYNKYWSIIGSSVSSYVMDFVNNYNLPPVLNFTYVVLIPKVKSPDKMNDFRPISLCNVIYKIGAKMVANRLKPVVEQIISQTQSAFIPKRLISDNILVAFELHHYINAPSPRKTDYMSIKLDISKAYDRVEWGFLRRVLLRLGMDTSFVNLIMLCVSSVSYSILLNGFPCADVRPERGIRQGDPLSPYLFICVVKAFIGLVTRTEREGRIHGVKISRKAPVITNLCFADDTMLFCKATEAEAHALKDILERYAKRLDKSSIWPYPRSFSASAHRK